MQMNRISGETHITRVCGATSKRYLRLGDFDDFKAVSTSSIFIFIMNALPDRFMSTTDPVSRNRCIKSVAIDEFGAVSPGYFYRNPFIT
ncbi:hypothetical protein TNCV_4833951 [Trichonephila clavipes]|nr:hypothetical protein TNCV_4833951 [Trichonephila clavipes]